MTCQCYLFPVLFFSPIFGPEHSLFLSVLHKEGTAFLVTHCHSCVILPTRKKEVFLESEFPKRSQLFWTGGITSWWEGSVQRGLLVIFSLAGADPCTSEAGWTSRLPNAPRPRGRGSSLHRFNVFSWFWSLGIPLVDILHY